VGQQEGALISVHDVLTFLADFDFDVFSLKKAAAVEETSLIF